MGRDDIKQIFLDTVEAPLDSRQLKQDIAALKAAGSKARSDNRIRLAAQLAHAAFLAPDHIGQVYDALSETWLGKSIEAIAISDLGRPAEPSPEHLWSSFWSVVEDAADGKLDALSVTARTAALGGAMPDGFVKRVAAMSHAYPGVSEAAQSDLPEKIDLATLASQPQGSIGAEFHQLIVENKFDLEVLDRSEIGLAALPAPLDYLNTRILQAHDLWHITAGYETTSLHEIALSGFQMAQFGHNYSAQFLSIVAAVAALSPASGYKILMDTVTTSWVHGRETCPMMLIPWESVWHKSADEIRADFQIQTYRRPYRADLIERTATIAALLRKISNLTNRFRRKQSPQLS